MAIIFSSEKEEEGSVGWYWVLFALRINPTFTLILKKLPYQSLHILYARLCLKDGTVFFLNFAFRNSAICKQCREHLVGLVASEEVTREPADSAPEVTGGGTQAEDQERLESAQEEVSYISN